MARYVILFSKTGYTKYTSHLDMLRLFKRAFRRAGVEIKYSQGFNPHPKMGFAQPLSLGYSAYEEMIEFESDCEYGPEILEGVTDSMPQGVRLLRIGKLPEGKKSLAASVCSAVYSADFPLPFYEKDYGEMLHRYCAQEQIIAEKKQKKTKKLVEVDIKEKIREIEVCPNDDFRLRLLMELDCGSQSNLSPELVIGTFISFCGLPCERYEVEVSRDRMILPVDFEIEWL